MRAGSCEECDRSLPLLGFRFRLRQHPLKLYPDLLREDPSKHFRVGQTRLPRFRHMNASKKKSDTNLVKLIEQFGCHEKCREHLTKLRWPDGVRCPRCAGDHVSRSRMRANMIALADTSYRYAGHDLPRYHLPLWKCFWPFTL
jgi:hypothetical protein